MRIVDHITVCCGIGLLALGCASTGGSAEPTSAATSAGAEAPSAVVPTNSAADDERVAGYLAAPEVPQGVVLVDPTAGKLAFRAHLEDGGRGYFNDHLFVVAVGTDRVVAHHTLIDADEGHEYGAMPPAFHATLEARRERAAATLRGFSAHQFEQAIVEYDVDAGRAEIYAQMDGGDPGERGELIHVLEEVGTRRPFLVCGGEDGMERRGPEGPPLELTVLYSARLGLLIVHPAYPWSDLCTDVETAAYAVRI